jgi:hypothetical protein
MPEGLVLIAFTVLAGIVVGGTNIEAWSRAGRRPPMIERLSWPPSVR